MSIEKLKFLKPILSPGAILYAANDDLQAALDDINEFWYSLYPEKTVIIPKGTKTIMSVLNYTTLQASEIQAVLIPNSVETISGTTLGANYAGAFKDCSSLTSITIPGSVTSISDGTFEGCTNIESISLPHVKSYFGAIFGGTEYEYYVPDSLKSITIIGNNVTSFLCNAFKNCSKLESISLPFIGKTLNGTDNTHFGYIFGAQSSTDNNAYVPTSLKSVTITGNNVNNVSSNTFYGCRNLTSIELPESVTSIGDGAFSGCSSLTSIEIPDSVTSVGNGAFSGCSNLTKVYSTDIANWCKINFNSYASTPLYRYSSDTIEKELYLNNTLVEDLVIPSTVETINNYTFTGCTSIKRVELPDSVTSIGEQAFLRCSNLVNINIPDSVTNIARWAFSYCSSLTSISIGNNVKEITQELFKDCTSLESVIIGSNVESISSSVFNGCSSLNSIVIPKSVTSIGNYAFKGCSSLASIKYRGTKAQWEAISKGTGWDNNTGDYTITYNYTGE